MEGAEKNTEKSGKQQKRTKTTIDLFIKTGGQRGAAEGSSLLKNNRPTKEKWGNSGKRKTSIE